MCRSACEPVRALVSAGSLTAVVKGAGADLRFYGRVAARLALAIAVVTHMPGPVSVALAASGFAALAAMYFRDSASCTMRRMTTTAWPRLSAAACSVSVVGGVAYISHIVHLAA